MQPNLLKSCVKIRLRISVGIDIRDGMSMPNLMNRGAAMLLLVVVIVCVVWCVLKEEEELVEVEL